MPVSATDLVVLRDGFTAPVAAVLLLLDLEARGFSIAADDDGLIVSPRSRLTTADDRAIRQRRDELIALVKYCEVIQ